MDGRCPPTTAAGRTSSPSPAAPLPGQAPKREASEHVTTATTAWSAPNRLKNGGTRPQANSGSRQWAAQCPGLAQRGRTPCQWSCQGRVRVVSGAVPIVVA